MVRQPVLLLREVGGPGAGGRGCSVCGRPAAGGRRWPSCTAGALLCWVLLCAVAVGAAFDCPSCAQVPCGECQEGCNRSSNGCGRGRHSGGSSRNGCSDGNRGCHPDGCTLPAPVQPSPPLPPGASFCDEKGWRRVFADEFGGHTLDRATWGSDMGWDTRSSLRDAKGAAGNIRVANGTLILRSLRQRAGPYTGGGVPQREYPNSSGFNYTSAAITTRGRRSFGGGGRCVLGCVWLLAASIPLLTPPRQMGCSERC
jgi:hypothetical protein